MRRAGKSIYCSGCVPGMECGFGRCNRCHILQAATMTAIYQQYVPCLTGHILQAAITRYASRIKGLGLYVAGCNMCYCKRNNVCNKDLGLIAAIMLTDPTFRAHILLTAISLFPLQGNRRGPLRLPHLSPRGLGPRTHIEWTRS